MRIVTSIGLLLVAAASARAAEDCTLKRIAEIPFERTPNLLLTVPAAIQDRPLRIMLDTGGAWSLIDKELVDELKLTRRNVVSGMYDGAGKPLSDVVRVRGMALGPVKLDVNFDFLVGFSTGGRSAAGWRATVGLNLFNAMDLEIDNAGNKISLFSPDHCRGAGVYWADEAVTLEMRRNAFAKAPIVDADLNGESVRVLFDTGSTMTSMGAKLAKRKFGITRDTPGVVPGNSHRVASGKHVDVFQYTFDKLEIAGVTFENVPVAIGPFDDGENDVTLGMNEMRHLHLYFAFKDRLLHITAADAGRPAAGPSTK